MLPGLHMAPEGQSGRAETEMESSPYGGPPALTPPPPALTPCVPTTWPPHCSSQVPGTVLPQGLCTCFSSVWNTLPQLTDQAWIKWHLLKEAVPDHWLKLAPDSTPCH